MTPVNRQQSTARSIQLDLNPFFFFLSLSLIDAFLFFFFFSHNGLQRLYIGIFCDSRKLLKSDLREEKKELSIFRNSRKICSKGLKR